MLRSPLDAAILRLAIPALGALAADPLVALVDTAYVGRLGTQALAAVALASTLFAIAVAGFNFLAYGTTPLIASRLGAGDRAAASRLASAAVLLAAAAGLVATAVLVLLPETLLGWLGASDEVLAPATTYLRIRAVGLVAVLLLTAGFGIFRGAQDAMTPWRVVVVLNVINLVLDPLLIFGLDWGVAGAAWASVIAQSTGAGLLGVMLWRRRDPLGFHPARPRRADFTALAAAGSRLVLRTAGLLAVFTAATSVAARLGTAALAAHQIAYQVFIFLSLALDAVAIAAQSVVGKAVGEKAPGQVRSLAERLVVLGAAAGLAIAGLLALSAPWLGGWFSPDGTVVAALGTVYPQLVLVQVIGGAVFAWDGIVMGATDFTIAMVATVVPAVAVMGWMLAIVPLGGTLPAVWWGIVLLMVLRAVVLGWWHRNRLPLVAA
ncbi:MAG: MATE family efflux transporter [Acidimicrobiia bacterium]|nr:MATE family efflux transporter [Acidimicrobiia bacterium]